MVISAHRDVKRMVKATYSLEDDKLRVYVGDGERLPVLIWQTLTGLGFRWAPRQRVLHAAWRPDREDAVLAACGVIATEYGGMQKRAELAAERYSDYADRARERAARDAARRDDILDQIPFGQPILVGHHSERRHRRDLDRVDRLSQSVYENTAKHDYWQHRAEAALNNVRKKYDPGVIARRLKKLHAEVRRLRRHRQEYPADAEWFERWIAHTERQIEFWEVVLDGQATDN